MPTAEKVARIDAVTVADVRKVMTDYTYDKVHTALVGMPSWM
jgi:hypothetical protein